MFTEKWVKNEVILRVSERDFHTYNSDSYRKCKEFHVLHCCTDFLCFFVSLVVHSHTESESDLASVNGTGASLPQVEAWQILSIEASRSCLHCKNKPGPRVEDAARVGQSWVSPTVPSKTSDLWESPSSNSRATLAGHRLMSKKMCFC